MTDATRQTRRSLFSLIGDVPRLVKELVQGEIQLIKTEMIAKLKSLGIGIGLLVGAAIVLLWFVAMLLTAAVLGLANVMPAWLAALVVAGVLLIIIAVLVLVGIRILKKGVPPIPEKGIAGLKEDVAVIQGVARPKPTTPSAERKVVG